MLKPHNYLFLFIVLIFSCNPTTEIVEEVYQPKDNREAYAYKLGQAKIFETALGQDWLSEGEKALEQPNLITTPFAEDFYINENEAKALGYRFKARRGQKILVEVEKTSKISYEFFLDAFRVIGDTTDQYLHVASAAENGMILEFEPRADGEYIIRFQTELLRGGIFRIEIQNIPALAFPVVGKDKSAIGSLFGAPRDGGRRKHHGVDIFARRHTPIIAPTEGRIRFVGERGLGGRVVWMRDTKRNQTLYFAHLHDILIEDDAYVYPGDTIGTVGNTGNARTTPPHLHFGIYKDGPIDPYHFIANTRTSFKRELANPSLIGQMARTKTTASLKTEGPVKGSTVLDLPSKQVFQIIGSSSSYYHILLPDETEGYISYSMVEPASKALRKIKTEELNTLFSSPNQSSFVIDEIGKGEEIDLYGRSNGFSFVKNLKGQIGWMKSIGG